MKFICFLIELEALKLVYNKKSANFSLIQFLRVKIPLVIFPQIHWKKWNFKILS